MNRNMLKNSLIGAGIGIGAALILLLVFCAVLTKCGDPARLVPVAAAFSDGEFRILPLLLVCLICTAISAVCGIIGVPGEKSGRAKRRAMMKRLSAGK